MHGNAALRKREEDPGKKMNHCFGVFRTVSVGLVVLARSNKTARDIYVVFMDPICGVLYNAFQCAGKITQSR